MMLGGDPGNGSFADAEVDRSKNPTRVGQSLHSKGVRDAGK
jgi:hypothetical protein